MVCSACLLHSIHFISSLDEKPFAFPGAGLVACQLLIKVSIPILV